MEKEKSQNNNKELRKRSWRNIISVPAIIGIVAGGAGGYLYYYLVGCYSGSCPITSNPTLTIIWGAVIGYLLGDMFTKRKKTTKDASVKPEDAK